MSVAEIRVRSAVLADVPRVVELERAASEAPHWAQAEYLAMIEGAVRSQRILRCLLVAEFGGLMAGFAVGKLVRFGDEAEAELESIVVTPGARRNGIGRALGAAVVAWCGEQRAGLVELEVRAGSAGAIALYRGLGFREVGRRRNYYKDPLEDAVLMRLDLEACGEQALPGL